MSTTATPPVARLNKPRPTTPGWAKLLLVLFVLLLIGAAAFGGIVLGKMLGANEERSVQVVRSVHGEEQVILVTAGVGGIETESDNQSFFGLFDVPFSDRQVFIQYDLDAKFGIEGKDIKIVPTSDKTYTITIPPFIYLGYSDPKFSVATESNGILSWTTPQIDKVAAVEDLLTDELIASHIEDYRSLLEVQAQTFYTRIVKGIEPEATLKFEYAK
ncbi:hypothetical protein [Microbacterium flavum]|uniref:DUF4230 domain-containing protein n=1 Tax=Microbacterium flavum TaxID=415216 RepID=A0ABS5XVS9_9MICO|nr:hypothetical protein [Microbacterium flavum]MBT8798643.1 hypothetical protein [Microbacterium flavum]